MFFRKRSRDRADLLYDGAVFHDTVHRERLRADRTEQPLALLTLTFIGANRSAENESLISQLLRERIRATDVVGRTLQGQIGILCPDTNPAGALKLSGDLKDILDQGDVQIAYELHLHGEKPFDPAEFRDPPIPVRDLSVWLAQPLPGWKRTVDVAGALLFFLFFSPLLLLVAVAVKATSPGPILFAQERSGLGGQSFQMLKFRSMQKDAEERKYELMDLNKQDGPAFKVEDDPRITAVGRVLRRSSIDELPQFWNVLRGEMSLVGPRPLPTEETRRCKAWHRRRIDVTPGLTCIWQVSGRPRKSFDKWVRLDIQYIQNRTPIHDAQLITRTIPAMIFGEDA